MAGSAKKYAVKLAPLIDTASVKNFGLGGWKPAAKTGYRAALMS